MEDEELSKENVKENVKGRIMEIMRREGLTAAAFTDAINVAQATISQILRGRNMPSTEVLFRLHKRYPDIDLNWLLTGEGSMSANEPTLSPADAASATESDANAYPLFAENRENAPYRPNEAENRKEMALGRDNMTPKEVVRQEIIYKERPPRRITEIRIFFDDNTYETFKPEK